ncbi:uncharacterized protein [Diabrotica undecimpunctata]|uniref:uncharacterized protein n=1 Tax=Diabrotica undecimpunctata TaxID=50387 RepID=UPI003B635556
MPEQLDELKIGSWNSGRIRSKINILDEITNRLAIDVMALQETRLVERIKTKIPGYVIYREDRTSRSGGTAIMVRGQIDHDLVPTPLGLVTMKATIVRIVMANETLKIVSAYVRPHDPVLNEDLDLILDSDEPTIIIGDLNARSPNWFDRRTNVNGRRLCAYLENKNNTIVTGPTDPTCFHGELPSHIDIAILHNIGQQHEIQSVTEGDSTHNVIVMTLGAVELNPLQPHQIKKIKWPNFRRVVSENIGAIPIINNIEELEESITKLEQTMLNAIDVSTKTENKITQKGRFKEISNELKDLIKEKNRKRRRAQRTRNQEDKRIANELDREVNRRLNEHRSEHWDNFIQELNPNQSAFWKVSKILRKDKKTYTAPTRNKR